MQCCNLRFPSALVSFTCFSQRTSSVYYTRPCCDFFTSSILSLMNASKSGRRLLALNQLRLAADPTDREILSFHPQAFASSPFLQASVSSEACSDSALIRWQPPPIPENHHPPRSGWGQCNNTHPETCVGVPARSGPIEPLNGAAN